MSKYSGFSKNKYSVPAYGLTTVEFTTTKPNYFRVQNLGAATVYCGTANIPTTSNYDFMIGASKSKMYAEPFGRTRLYIFNPSGSACDCIVLSFEAEFDPAALAMAEMEIDLDSSGIQIEQAISSFECALPSGTNSIGNVGLNAGSKVIGKVGLDTSERSYLLSLKNDIGNLLSANSVSGKKNLADIITAISNSGGGGGSSSWTTDNITEILGDTTLISDIKTIITMLANYQKQTTIFNKSGSVTLSAGGSESITCANPKTISKINYVTNDSDANNVLVTITNLNGTDQATSIHTLKPGETLNDLEVYSRSIVVSSASGANIRYGVTIRTTI